MQTNRAIPPKNIPLRGGGPNRGFRGVKEKPKDFKKTLMRLLKYLGTSKNLLIMMLLITIITTIATLVTPIFTGKIIDAIDVSDKSLMFKLIFTLAAIYVLNVVMIFFRGIITAYLSENTVRRMRKDLFSNLIYLPIKYFDNHPHGDIMSRMTNDVDSISSTISQSISSFFSAVLMVVGSFLVMLIYSPLLTAISLVSLGLSLIATRFMAKKMRKYFSLQQQLLGELNSHVEENVTGHKTVAAFSKQTDIQKAFNVTSDKLEGYAIRAQIFSGAMGPMMNIITNVGFMLIVVCGAWFYVLGIGGGLLGALTIGNIIMFVNCSRQFSRPINEIANLYAQIETSFAAAERIFAIMDERKEVNDGTIKLPDDYVINKISFEHVDFSYVAGESVLRDFNLAVSAGEQVALVGATGSGKTTVVNLLMRFYDIDAGSIKINDVDIRNIDKDNLRRTIAIVLQDTVLFSDTIKTNIAYGNLDADFSAIVGSAKFSRADQFINRLSEKYDTKLSEGGSNLSQGQRQLLSISRAALAEPKILILDEATSSVDTRTEQDIQKAMINLMKNRTSLVIAHRLSTIRDADKIAVIDKGHVVEIGNHDELMKAEGVYYRLYQTQFAGNTI